MLMFNVLIFCLISGMNMPMLLTLALERTEETTLEELGKKAIHSNSIGVKLMQFNEKEKKKRAKLSVNKN